MAYTPVIIKTLKPSHEDDDLVIYCKPSHKCKIEVRRPRWVMETQNEKKSLISAQHFSPSKITHKTPTHSLGRCL